MINRFYERILLVLAAGALAALMAAPMPVRSAPSVGKLVLALGTAPPDITAHQFYYALENGFYRDEGLELEIKPLVGDQSAVRAIVAGEADVAWTGFAASLQAIQAGAQLKGISSTGPKLDYIFVAQKSIASIRDLVGKNLGTSTPGAVSHQVPRLMMEMAGIDSNRVNVVAVGGSAARVQALIARRIDAAVLNSSFAARALKYDYLHAIGDAAKDLPTFIYSWEVALRRTTQQKRPAIQAFVTGSIRGARWGMQNPDKATLISQRILPDVPKDEITAGVTHFAEILYWTPDGVLPRESWNFTVAALLRSDEIRVKMYYPDHFLMDFVKAANAKLGPFRK